MAANPVKPKKRGIVLVTTLLTVVLVVMMVTTVVHSGISGLALTANFYDHEAALMAAESGLQYATTRLQQNISWRGNDPTSVAALTDPSSLAISEDQGNVIGVMTSRNGNRSAFRIKFNYEDNGQVSSTTGTAPDLDSGLSNHSSAQVITSEYVSVNNLMGSISVPVYRNGANGLPTASKLTDLKSAYSLPKATCCVIVEGFAGPGVRDASLKDLYKTPSNCVKRTIESYLSFDPEGNSMDSVACAAGNINASLASGGRFEVTAASGSDTPRLRSLGNVNVNSVNGTFSMPSGEVFYGLNGNSFTFNGSSPDNVNSRAFNSSNQFKQLAWEDIPKAASGPNNINAGTYVWSTNEKGARVLKYYEGTYPPGTDLPTEGGSIVNFSSNSAVSLNGSDMSIMFKKNVYINPVSNGGSTCSDFIIRTDSTTDSYRPTVGFVPANDGSKSSILSSDGDIFIDGATMGAGALTSKGNITLQGPSLLESDPETGVSIYAQGDVTLNEISKATIQAAEVENPGSTDPENVNTDTGKTGNADLDALQASDYLKSFNEDQLQYLREAGKKAADTGVIKIGDLPPTNVVCPFCSATMNHTTGVCDQIATIGEALVDYQEFYKAHPDVGTEFGSASENTPEIVEAATIPAINNAGSWKDYGYKNLQTKNMGKKTVYLDQILQKYKKISYSDQDISGIIYTWGNLNVNIGNSSLLHVTGTIVAYGGDPTGSPASIPGSGNINLKARDVELEYDPSYIKELLSGGSSLLLKRTLWNAW